MKSATKNNRKVNDTTKWLNKKYTDLMFYMNKGEE